MTDNQQESILKPAEGTLESIGQNIPEDVPEVTQTPSTEVESVGDSLSDFLKSLPKELQDIPTLKKFKDGESLAKSYVNIEKMLGKKLEGMSPEELKSVYGKMNSVPTDPSGYEFKGVEHLDDSSREFLQKTAHDLNLTPEQATQLAATIADVDSAAMQQRIEQHELTVKEAKEALKKDWGKQLDYRIKLANDAIVEFGGEELASQLEASGLSNNVPLIKAFAKIGENLLESGLVGETGLGQFGMSPEQASHKIGTLKQSREFMDAFLGARHPGHKAAVEEMYKLRQIESSHK